MEASLEDVEEMKDSVDVYYTGASTKASTTACMDLIEAFLEVMEASIKVCSIRESFDGSFRGSFSRCSCSR